MKTTLDLPDDLVKQIKIRAVNENMKLKDAMADLLRHGLAATASSPTVVRADKAMLKRRRDITRKFISGEWGVELAGFEEGREADRRKAVQRDKAWRS